MRSKEHDSQEMGGSEGVAGVGGSVVRVLNSESCPLDSSPVRSSAAFTSSKCLATL